MPRAFAVLAVFKRNFWSYFSGMIGYLFIVVFVILGAFLAFRPEFFTNNLANLDQLNEWFPLLLLFIVPAITMSAWADERKLGTDELLFTLPISDVEALLGKYLAVLAVYSVALLFSLAHSAFLAYIGNPDWGLIATTYLGYWLAGAALLSAGMVASTLTSSVTVAFVLGAVICAIPVFVGYAWYLWPDSDLIRNLSLQQQFRDFGMGMVPLTGLLYFVSLIVFMLYLNAVLIARRHWSAQQNTNMGLQYAVRVISLGIILISVNAVAANANRRVDLTAEHLYSLTPTTRTLLREVDEKRPVMIQAFVSKDVPRDYVPVRKSLLGMLEQYDQIGGKNIETRVVEVEPYSKEAEQARQYGIEPRQVQTERGGRILTEDIFLGAVINSGANEVVVPFFDVGTPIEYELTRSVRTVAKEDRLTVGILETDARVMGGFDTHSFRSQPEWRIVTELKKQYKVEAVPAGTPIDESKYDVLIAVEPSSLSQAEMLNLVQYVEKGKPVLLFDDPLPTYKMLPGGMIQSAPKLPKQRDGGMMQFQQSEPKADNGEATTLLNTLEIAWDNGTVVWDTTFKVLHPEYGDVVRPEMVSISPQSGVSSAFSPRSNITKGLQEVLLFFSGTVRPRANSDLNFEPLMRTGQDSGLIPWSDLTQPGIFGMGVTLANDPPLRMDDESHVIACHVTAGKKGDKTINAVFVADVDLISDWVFQVRERELYGLRLDNVTFVLNAVDTLAGDEAYIELRKRQPRHRTLEAVEKETAKFIQRRGEEREKANEQAKQALEAAKARLAKKVEEIKNDESLDQMARAQLLAIAQADEQRKVDVEEAKAQETKQRQIEQVKAETERQIRAIENRYRLWAVLAPPIPAILLGIVMWSYRLRNERRNILPQRMRAPRR